MNKCKHKWVYLDVWYGSKKYGISDKWVFHCEHCLKLKAISMHTKNVEGALDE